MKIKTVVCVALLTLLLAGCASDYKGNNISKLIDPEIFGSVLPKSAPSTELPAEGSAKHGYEASLPDTIYTVDMQWEISGGYFISEEFKFAVNPVWRDCFDMECEQLGTNDLNLRTFDFYYVEADTGIRVRLFRIDVMPASMVDDVGTLGGEELGRNKDETYAYVKMLVRIDDDDLPAEFHSGGDIYNILIDLSSDAFDFSVIA